MSNENKPAPVNATDKQVEIVDVVSVSPDSAVASAKKPSTRKTQSKKATVSEKKQEKTPARKSTKTRKKVAQTPANEITSAFNFFGTQSSGYDEIVSFAQDNLDAFIAANTCFIQGIQTFNQELLEIAQVSFDENAKAHQKVYSCKTVEEVVSVHSELIKDNLNTTLDKGRKLGDLGVKIVEDSALPITERVNTAVETMTKPIAA